MNLTIRYGTESDDNWAIRPGALVEASNYEFLLLSDEDWASPAPHTPAGCLDRTNDLWPVIDPRNLILAQTEGIWWPLALVVRNFAFFDEDAEANQLARVRNAAGTWPEVSVEVA